MGSQKMANTSVKALEGQVTELRNAIAGLTTQLVESKSQLNQKAVRSTIVADSTLKGLAEAKVERWAAKQLEAHGANFAKPSVDRFTKTQAVISYNSYGKRIENRYKVSKRKSDGELFLSKVGKGSVVGKAIRD
jgi:hypothetical protein